MGQEWVKGLRPCLACNIFAKRVFWFKGVFGKHPIMLVSTVLLQKN